VHIYTSPFRAIFGFSRRLPSHTNSVKLYRLHVDLLTESASRLLLPLTQYNTMQYSFNKYDKYTLYM